MIISPPVAPQTRESHRLAESDEAVIIPPEHGDAGIDTYSKFWQEQSGFFKPRLTPFNLAERLTGRPDSGRCK